VTAIAKHAEVQKNGTATFMARVLGESGVAIQQSDVAGIAYSVYLLDENDPNAESVVTGHSAVSVSVASAVFDSLQGADPRWDAGYNFLHTLSIAANQAFSLRGRRYLVRFTFTPASGQVLHVDYLLAVR
jgi:hypothetical protein